MRCHALVVALAFCVGTATSALAEGLSFSGYIDTAFNYNVSRPAGRVNKYHPYHKRANSFGLGTVYLAASGPTDGLASYVVQIDSGMYAGVNSGNPNRFFDIQEAYGTWKIKELNSATLKVGKFVTYEGIELIESPFNPVITHGILFSWAEPFTHTGAAIQIPLTSKFDVAVGLINGWDLVEDTNDNKMLAGRLGGNYGYLSWGLSGYFGKEVVVTDPATNATAEPTRSSADLTGVWTVNDALAVNFQGNWGQDDLDGVTSKWMGAGLQPVYKLNKRVTLSGRGEFFDDSDGARTGDAQKLISMTGAAAYQVGPSTRIRGEVRLDSSDVDVFNDDNGDATGTQIVGTIQFVQSF